MTNIPPLERGDTERSIVDRFTRVVGESGGRTAVAGDSESLTYRELDLATDTVARRIVERQGEAPAPVALLFDQGSAFVVAVLATLKAGKCFVPLDPRNPGHAEAVRAAAGCRLLLHDAQNHCAAADMAGTQRLSVVPPFGRSGKPPTAAAGPEAPCYIYFTTGSTGTPKGVLDIQRNVLHNAYRYTQSLKVTSSDRLSMIQSPSFSGCMSSLFTALLNGATLCPFDLRSNGLASLARWIDEQSITIFHSVPSIFCGLAVPGRTYRSVRLIRLEGDRATRSCIDVYLAHFAPACRVVVGLGATECGLVCRFEIDRAGADAINQPPLGYGCPDMRVRILDDDGRERPAGEIGEIVVDSQFLASGYWRRPELTARVFDRLDQQGNLRRYRTGDLGRMDPDGCLHYVSRKGARLRVNGETVDPGRIEAAVVGTGLARHCVVTQHDDSWGTARLAVHYVSTGSPPVEPLTFNRALIETLPFALLPRWYVPVADLPTSADGKVAVDRLPVPEAIHRVGALARREPASDAERTVARLWESVLGFHVPDTRQNVFELGVDSLAAGQLLLAVNEHYGIVLTIDRVYDNPTIAGIAEAVETSRKEAPSDGGPPRDNRRDLRRAAGNTMRERRR